MSRFIKLSLLAFIASLFFISCEKELSEENGNLPGAPDTTNNGGGGSNSCGTPTGVSGSSTVAGTVNLTWTAVTGAISYSVQYRVLGTSQWYSDLSTTNSMTISNLTATSNYEFQVQSICTVGTSAYSASTNLMPSGSSTSCDVPTGLTATNVTETEATLNWSAVAGAMSYNIQYRAVGSPTWVNTTSTTNSSNLTSLFGGVDYEFQVQTVCSGGLSAFSTSGSFTTLSTINTACKACSYQPWCDGSVYNYIDTTDGTPAAASETITILGTTNVGGLTYDITRTAAGDTVLHNCDSNNQVTQLILNIDPLGTGPVQITSTLIKSNLGAAPWTDNYTISGYNITASYSLVGSFASRTVLGVPYNDVIQIHQEISAVISPLLPPTVVSTADYYYALGIGLIEQLTNDTYPGSAPSTTHRVLETYFIP